MPAVVSCPVAMPGAISQECVTGAEADFRDGVAGLLVTSTSQKTVDGPLRESHRLVEVAFRVSSGA